MKNLYNNKKVDMSKKDNKFTFFTHKRLERIYVDFKEIKVSKNYHNFYS